MSYYPHNKKNPAKTMPFAGIEPDIKKQYEPDEILPVNLSKITLITSLSGLPISRGKFLTDRRIKVRQFNDSTASLLIEFNFEDFIIQDIGREFALNEIDRVLTQVENEVRGDILPTFDIRSAQISSVAMFRLVSIPAETERAIKLLHLLSRDRGGQDLENLVPDPCVPYWFEGTILAYNRSLGKLSPDLGIKTASEQLRSDQIRFEARDTDRNNQAYSKPTARELVSNFPKFVYQYSSSCVWPFDVNLRQLQHIEMNASIHERDKRENRHLFDRTAYRPFAEQSAIDLIKYVKTLLCDYGN